MLLMRPERQRRKVVDVSFKWSRKVEEGIPQRVQANKLGHHTNTKSYFWVYLTVSVTKYSKVEVHFPFVSSYDVSEELRSGDNKSYIRGGKSLWALRIFNEYYMLTRSQINHYGLILLFSCFNLGILDKNGPMSYFTERHFLLLKIWYVSFLP